MSSKTINWNIPVSPPSILASDNQIWTVSGKIYTPLILTSLMHKLRVTIMELVSSEVNIFMFGPPVDDPDRECFIFPILVRIKNDDKAFLRPYLIMQRIYDIAKMWCENHDFPAEIWVECQNVVYNKQKQDITEVYNGLEVRTPCKHCGGTGFHYPKKKPSQLDITNAKAV